jgi:hypothetical protein
MAPRLRSGKGLTRDEIDEILEAIRSGTANSTGFPALPTELLLEIVSHFPAVPIPSDDGRYIIYPAPYLEKKRILRALSQMCRSLRSVFLPYVWQRIEVCASHMLSYEYRIGPLWPDKRRLGRLMAQELATELIAQLEIVTIRDPALAQHVKYSHIPHCRPIPSQRILC